MTGEPEWLTAADVIDAHPRQLRVFGGAAGIRDEGALESAIERPVNKWRYERAKLAELAAAYSFGIVRNHPFVDGNKRAGFMAMVGFPIQKACLMKRVSALPELNQVSSSITSS